ncbi:tyrosine-type recombinase/integrase [Muribacter muris]|uniref:tyrosine-type recombinase/integrase n=1 Tax=Muribacter muris TaxID=67855 RepID=UPI003B97DF3A
MVFQIKSTTHDTVFRKMKDLAGLGNEDLHFHDSRREALSRLAKKVDVMTLAKISGHRDIKILLNTYYAPDMADIAKSIG